MINMIIPYLFINHNKLRMKFILNNIFNSSLKFLKQSLKLIMLLIILLK